MKISILPAIHGLGMFPFMYVDKIAKRWDYSVGFEYMIKSGVEVDKVLLHWKNSNNQGIFGQTFADKELQR